MNEPLILIGAALVAGAIVGGSLKVADVVELPSIIDSIPRQILLGCFGAIVMVIGLIGPLVADSPNGGKGITPDPNNLPGLRGEPARIELSKDRGRPGTTLSVSGVGFDPNEDVELYWNERELRDDIKADDKGRFSDVRVKIPSDSDPFFSPYTITATGRSSIESDHEEFDLTGDTSLGDRLEDLREEVEPQSGEQTP